MSVKALAMNILQKQKTVPNGPSEQTPLGQWDGWPKPCLESAKRFAQPHAILFPLLGRKVRTPSGPGTLIQVFAERAIVVLDADLDSCLTAFDPAQIKPLQVE